MVQGTVIHMVGITSQAAQSIQSDPVAVQRADRDMAVSEAAALHTASPCLLVRPILAQVAAVQSADGR